MNEIAFAILAALVIAEAVGFALFYRAAGRREDRLLDRIMAKNYTDFVYTTKTEAEADALPIAPEAPDAAWHAQNMKDHPEQYPDGIEAYD